MNHTRWCRANARCSCAADELGLGLDDILALHDCVERIVGLGAAAAVVRALNGELVATCQSGPEVSGTTIIARRLQLVDLGVVSAVELDMSRLDAEAMRVDTIIRQAVVANGVGAAR